MSREIKCDDLLLKLDLEEPSEYAKKKAQEELRETPENIESGLRVLKELIKGDPDLVIPPNEDKWLIGFLRRAKFYPESAFQMLKNYFQFRRKYSKITESLNPQKLQHVFAHDQVSILPQRDQFGRRILTIMSGEKWNPKLVPRDDGFYALVLCCDALQMEPETQINGIVFIMDLKGVTLRQTFEATLPFLKCLADFIEMALPLRLKGFHCVNVPRIGKPPINLCKKLLPSKLSSRFITHDTNLTSLHQYVEPDFLPICYGGSLNAKSAYGCQTFELLSHVEDYFEKWQKYGYVENRSK